MRIANQSGITNRASSVTTEGVVVEALPHALYRVEIDGRHQITAHIGGGLDKNFVRILVGDRVLIELAQKDLTRGRITRVVGVGRKR